MGLGALNKNLPGGRTIESTGLTATGLSPSNSIAREAPTLADQKKIAN